MSSSVRYHGYGTHIPTNYTVRPDGDRNEDALNEVTLEGQQISSLEELVIVEPEENIFFCASDIGRSDVRQWCIRGFLFWLCQLVLATVCLAILIGIIVYLM